MEGLLEAMFYTLSVPRTYKGPHFSNTYMSRRDQPPPSQQHPIRFILWNEQEHIKQRDLQHLDTTLK
jgi:hypothetical protein